MLAKSRELTKQYQQYFSNKIDETVEDETRAWMAALNIDADNLPDSLSIEQVWSQAGWNEFPKRNKTIYLMADRPQFEIHQVFYEHRVTFEIIRHYLENK